MDRDHAGHRTNPMNIELPRRKVLQGMLAVGGGLSLASSLVAHRGAAQDSGTVSIADPGGPYTEAWSKAYHEPFREETGIDSVQIARQHEPVAEVKAQVEANNITWDAVVLTESAHKLLSAQALLEPLSLDPAECRLNDLMPEAVAADWLGIDVVGTIFAYRTDKFEGTDVPQSWTDFWDVEKFPGRRGMYQSPFDTLEEALLSAGVARDELYPLDLDLAFATLDKIKSEVVWFTGGAQATQMLTSGEVDMIATWNGRAQAAIDAGAPAKIVWNNWLAQQDGISILKGAPNAENAREFICFMTRPDLMAEWTEYMAYGPTNPKAYETIPADRAATLPASSENIEQMIRTDSVWRAENTQALLDRFNGWIAS